MTKLVSVTAVGVLGVMVGQVLGRWYKHLLQNPKHPGYLLEP